MVIWPFSYLLETVFKILLPGNSLKEMHSLTHYILNRIVLPKVITFCNLLEDLVEKVSI